MKPANPAGEAPDARPQSDGDPSKAPAPDTQPEGAGSSDVGTQAARVMKQTSKTAAESDGKL